MLDGDIEKMCVLETIWENIEKIAQRKKCIIKSMIRWKIPYKKTFQMLTYILNGWEITKIILAKQKSSSNETKINNK